MSSPQTTQADVEAVAEAIRSHDRFLVTTHENPDGDALGSLLAMKLTLDHLGKDSVMYLAGEATHETLWGTIDGAWESGERAAEAALRRIGALRDAEPAERPAKSRRRAPASN